MGKGEERDYFRGVQQSTLTPTTTPAPTQDPSVPCQLSTLNYDVYMIVDTSAQIQAADFAAVSSITFPSISNVCFRFAAETSPG